MLLAAGAALYVALLKAASPPTPSYEIWQPTSPPPAAVVALTGVAQQVAHKAHRPLAVDHRLERAAQGVLDWSEGLPEGVVPMALLRHAAWDYGWTDGELGAIVLRARAKALPMALSLELQQALESLDATHIGLALGPPSADPDERTTVLVALSRRLVHLGPIPKHRRLHATLSLSGTALDANITALRAVARRPLGDTLQAHLTLKHGHFRGELPTGGHAGPFDVEILAERGRGPEVAATFEVVVGDRHLPVPHAFIMTQTQDAPNLHALMALVQSFRQSHQLVVPNVCPALEQVAQDHAQDMQDHHFFAHVSPTTGDVTDRLRARAVPYAHVVENLAQDETLTEAFAQWLSSPGHLRNLADARVDHMGGAVLVRQQPGGPAQVTLVLVMTQQGPQTSANPSITIYPASHNVQ